MPIENHRLGRVVLQRSVHVLNHFRALSAKLIVYILTVIYLVLVPVNECTLQNATNYMIWTGKSSLNPNRFLLRLFKSFWRDVVDGLLLKHDRIQRD